jgi:hypothetical protein
MGCQYHEGCNAKVERIIKLPTGAVRACQAGFDEWRRLWGYTQKQRRGQMMLGEIVTEDQIATLKLTKKERKEIDGLNPREREGVLKLLLAVKQRKTRKPLTAS